MNIQDFEILRKQLDVKFAKWKKISKKRSLKKLKWDTKEWFKEFQKIEELEPDTSDNAITTVKNATFYSFLWILVLRRVYFIQLTYSSRLEKELERYKKTKTRKNKI